MKTRFLAYLLLPSFLLFTSCDVLNSLPSTLSTAGGPLTNAQIGGGLKDALRQGITNGVKELIQTDGYFQNAAIKLLLPPEAEKVQNIITKYVPGGQKLVDDAILKMNRAAEDAANEAAPIFGNAITSMSFDDAKNILFGADNAATTYLKSKTYQSLVSAYSPRINNSLEKVGASQAWTSLVNPYNKFANSVAGRLVKDAEPINPDLGAYVTEKALEGVFFKVKNEEVKIRENVSSRSTKLMQDVFGMLDKEKNKE
jgi:hypothetical protein